MTHKRQSPHNQDSPTSPKLSALENYDSAADYDSAIGWQPKYPNKKLRDDYRKKHPESFCRDSLLETRAANKWLRSTAAKKHPAYLFGGLWRTGELAVLVGEGGVGKSVMAVQIAESIARGKSSPTYEGGVAAFRGRGGSLQPQNVLYLDLEHTEAQFAERYSCPSPIPGKLPVKYRFSSRLSFTRFGEIDIPEAFNGDLARYFDHSLNLTLADEDAKVIVIDNLSWLDPKATGTSAAIRRMRSLKLYAMTNKVSILVIHNVCSPRHRSGSGLSSPLSRLLSLQDIVPGITEPADSVFALQRSTYGPDYRYIKPLKVRIGSNSDGVLSPNGEVLVYQLGRLENTWLTERGHPGRKRDSNGACKSSNSQFSIISSQLTALPFLGFKYLGPANESDLIRDYVREARAAVRTASDSDRVKQLRSRSARSTMVDGIISGEYQRYIDS